MLVEPRIPQNTGNIARTCAVTGAGLDLVGELGFVIDDAKLRRAGMDYWYSVDVKRWGSVDELLAHYHDYTPYFFSTKARRIFSAVRYPSNTLLIFGREDRGLPEQLIKNHWDTAVRIPMSKGFRSLNLASSAAIAAYEVLRQDGYRSIL